MNTRQDFQDKLVADIVPNVYFQPPASKELKYPCIVYNINKIAQTRADNLSSYFRTTGYLVTVIENTPDGDIYTKLLDTFPQSRFDRAFVSNNLHHKTLIIYY